MHGRDRSESALASLPLRSAVTRAGRASSKSLSVMGSRSACRRIAGSGRFRRITRRIALAARP